MKTLRIKVVIIFVMIAVFDVAMFIFLPDDYASRFIGYRRGNLLGSDAVRYDDIVIRDVSPRDYYVRHDERGFDIRINAKGQHHFDGMSYAVWSNSIGCFDIEHARYDRYVYLAGDSTAWGYTPFEEKFGTLLERWTGKQVLKCGVTHTGQRHQYEKLVDITEKIGVLPETILVIYESNDVFNDYAHPHTTVISGWLIDSAELGDDNQVRRIPYAELQEQAEARLDRRRKARERDGWWGLPKVVIRHYSMTAHLANLLIKKATLMITAGASAPEQSHTPAYRNVNDLLREVDGKQWYLDNPYARENKEALLDFKSFAGKNDIRLIVVLMPSKAAAAERDGYYEQTRLFLERNDIEFIDPAFSLVRNGVVWSDLFWENDHHPNPAGNRVIAEILMQEIPQTFLAPAASGIDRLRDGGTNPADRLP